MIQFLKNSTLLLILSICTYLCFVGLVLFNKKSICIDSIVVQRIDIINSFTKTSNSESVYNCNAEKNVNYSLELEALVTQLEKSIYKTTTVLNSIRPFGKKIEIQIYKNAPYKFEVIDSKIQIGISYLNLEQHLNRALVKAWINSHKKDLKVNIQMYEESIADLILFIIDGKIELEDPLDKVRTKVGSAKWPQVIKNIQGYCTSSWKYSEHTESCFESRNTSFKEDEKIAVFSLRPLLTSALVSAYIKFDYMQKQKFIQIIPKLVSDISLTPTQMIHSLLLDKNPLRNGIVNINKFVDLIFSSDQENQTEIYQLYTGVTQYLQLAGVTDTFAEAQFDYMIEYNGELNTQSSFYKKLEIAAYQNSDVQIALKDNSHIWILPSKTALPISIFNKLHAQQLVYVSCPINEIQLTDYFQKAEKMMLISYCDKSIEIQFDSLFSKGVKNFIALNSRFNFIQLHLPSLELIKDQIDSHQNFFELVKNKDINKNEFKKLGWSQVQWNKDLKAYQPQAIIDAIEYYRN